MITSVFLKLVSMSVTAGIIAAAVILLRLTFRRAPKRLVCLMWTLVALRLVIPFSLESPFSLVPTPLTNAVVTQSTFTVSGNNPTTVQTEIPHSDDTPHVTETPQDHSVPADDNASDPTTDHNVISPTDKSPSDRSVTFSDIVRVLSVVWLIGVCVMLAYYAVNSIRVRMTVREAVRDGAYWRCDRVRGPFVLGVLRPRVIVPSYVREAELEYIVAHEKAHVSRRDNVWKPLAFVLLAVYWFNPLMWISTVLFYRDIEAACDEKVIASYGEKGKKQYAEALLDCTVAGNILYAGPLAFGGTDVGRRIRGILGYKKPSAVSVAAAVLAMTVIAVCFLTDPVSALPDDPFSPIRSERHAFGTVVNISMESSRLYTVDFDTGEYVSICREKNCTHDTPDCPFYGASVLNTYYDDLVYYFLPPDNAKREAGLYRFNLTDGSSDFVMPYEVYADLKPKSLTPLDDCVFLFVTDSDAEGSSLPDGTVSIYRYDFVPGETKYLGNNDRIPGSTPKDLLISDADAETVTWDVPSAQVVTDRDINVISVTETQITGTNEYRLIMEQGKRTYELSVTDYPDPEYKEWSTARKTLYIIDKESGEKKPILENVYDNPLYIEENDVFLFLSTPAQRGGDPTKPVSVSGKGTEVWTVNGDGTNLRRICTLEDAYYGSDITGRIRHFALSDACIDGKVMIRLYHRCALPEIINNSVRYATEDMNGCAIVDVESGEYRVVYPDNTPTPAVAMTNN